VSSAELKRRRVPLRLSGVSLVPISFILPAFICACPFTQVSTARHWGCSRSTLCSGGGSWRAPRARSMRARSYLHRRHGSRGVHGARHLSVPLTNYTHERTQWRGCCLAGRRCRRAKSSTTGTGLARAHCRSTLWRGAARRWCIRRCRAHALPLPPCACCETPEALSAERTWRVYSRSR
jgi:hypothetical protein